MTRIGNKVLSSVIACVVAVSLAACGGRHSSQGALPSAVQSPGTTVPSDKLVTATFTFKIPAPATSSKGRKPSYISAATKSIRINMTADTQGVAIISQFNVLTPVTNSTGTSPGSPCTGSGPWTCVIPVQVPPGDDTFTFTTYDDTTGTGTGASHILSQQIKKLTLTAGTANAFTVTFDANAATMTVTGSGFCAVGTVANGSTFGSVGTQTVNFTVGYTDPATKTIVAPGLPTLSVNGHTDDNSTAGYTITGTGGNVTVKVYQSTQSYTLTPTTSNAGATINVAATPSSGTDGLTFNQTLSYTFQTGTAPPATKFLAAVEQSSSNAGQIDFFMMSLGGSGGPDTFSAYSTATLAVTSSTNEAGKVDVDNPESLHWDMNGDLLIGNGHDGSVNSGNMACVPVGAIANGTAQSTTVSASVSSPVGMAYDSRDGSVALANLQPGATYNLSQYLLTGNYTAAPAGQNIKVNQTNLGSNGGIANITTLPAGSYAIALSDGAEMDTNHGAGGKSEIALINGSTHAITHISDPQTSPGVAAHGYAIDQPWGLAWDAQNSQLVISNNSVWHELVSFYDAAGNFVSSIHTAGHPNNIVATSPDGHVAVAQLANFLGYPQVQIFDNTASRNPVFGPIPFNGCSGGSHIYGSDVAVVQSLEWLSNPLSIPPSYTKLLIGLKSTSAGVYTAKNGLYIYDISTSAVPAGNGDTGGCTGAAFAAAPVQSGFHQLSARPFGTAYKP